MKRPSSSEQIPKESQEINAAFTGFDSMEACMLGLMTDGKIAYVNQSTCDMLGYLSRLKADGSGALWGRPPPV